jgi:putative transposase
MSPRLCVGWGSGRSTESREPATGTLDKVYPYLLRDVVIDRVNQVWALDTTYVPMARGFVYLTAVIDVASRCVLAHRVATTLEACHAVEALEQAFSRYGTPEIVNTNSKNIRASCSWAA